MGFFRFNNRYKPIACPLKHVDKKDSVTVKGKAPNTLYIEKRNLMKQKLEMLGEDIDKNKESLQKAKEIAGEKASEYFNKAMN